MLLLNQKATSIVVFIAIHKTFCCSAFSYFGIVPICYCDYIFHKGHRLRASMRRLDPEAILMRRFSMQTARRRQYSVPAPNSLWHIDGNHKLIR